MDHFHHSRQAVAQIHKLVIDRLIVCLLLTHGFILIGRIADNDSRVNILKYLHEFFFLFVFDQIVAVIIFYYVTHRHAEQTIDLTGKLVGER